MHLNHVLQIQINSFLEKRKKRCTWCPAITQIAKINVFDHGVGWVSGCHHMENPLWSVWSRVFFGSQSKFCWKNSKNNKSLLNVVVWTPGAQKHLNKTNCFMFLVYSTAKQVVRILENMQIYAKSPFLSDGKVGWLSLTCKTNTLNY